MEKEIFTLSELDAQPEADRPDTFTLSEIDAMETKEFNNSDIDLSQFLQIPESVYKGWETQGKMGYAEATNRKDLIEAVPFAGSATSAGALWKTNNAMQRISKNAYGEDKKQRNEDIMRVQRYALAIEERRVRGVSIMGQIAEGVTELPAFAGEFMLSGGIASAGAIATKQVAKKAIEAALKKAMSKKVANAVVGAVGGAAARTATTGVVRVAEGFQQRQVDARLEPTEKGIKLAQEIGEKPFTSFFKAIADTLIENLSEVSGAGFNFVGKGIIKSVVPKRMSDGIIRLYKKLHPDDDIGRLLTKTGYNGFISELGEERFGSFLRAVAGVDDFGAKNPNSVFDRVVASVPSGEQLLVEAGVLSVPMLGSSAVRGAFRPKAADKLADTLLEEEQIDAIINDSPKTADDIAGISPKSQEGNTSQKVTADSAVSLRQLQVSRERFIEAGDTKAVALLDKLIEKNINQSPAEIPYVKDGKVHIYGIPEESTMTEAAIKFGAKYRGNEEMLNRIIDQKKINSQKLKDTFSVPVDKQDAAFDKMQEDLASTGHFLGEVIQEINGGLKNAEKPIMVPEFKESKDAIKYGSENKGQLPVLEKALEDVNNAIDKSSGGNEGFVLAKKATLLTESIRAAKGELTEEKAMAAIDKIKAQATKGVAKLSPAQQAIKDGLTEVQFVKAQQLTQTLRGTNGMTADQIQKQHPNIMLTKDIVAKDVYGNKVKIPDGEKLTPLEMKDGKIVLQGRQTYVVSKNKFANIKGNSVGGEAKPFAPELDGTEETVKGTIGTDVELKKLGYTVEKDMSGDVFITKNGEDVDFNDLPINLQKLVEGAGDANPTKFSPYQLPGGKDYKEILIKAPQKSVELPEGWKYKQELRGSSSAQWEVRDARDNFKGSGPDKQTALGMAIGGEAEPFRGSHWDEPNVIAHLRLNLRIFQGKLVTFMEELQSDWAREGRSKGFIRDRTPAEMATEQGLVDKGVQSLATGKIGEIPNNPLLKNWQVMSIKRALKEAVDNGSEYFSWINGEQTSVRYSLATKVDNVEWLEPAKGKGKVISIRPLKSDGGAGSSIDINIDPTGKIIKSDKSDWKGKSLDEVLGKGLADKIMEKESGNLSGDGLKFGGEWANNLYDKQVGNIVKDLTGAEIDVMDMGLSVDGKKKGFYNVNPAGGNTGIDTKITDLKIGKELKQAGGNNYIITDILGDGKFKAVPKSGTTMDRVGKEALVNGEYSKVPEIYKETFDISTKTTTQQGIRLTPEIKARIRGEALDIQTSGRQFEDTTSQLRADYQAAKATPSKSNDPASLKNSTVGQVKAATSPEDFRRRIEQLNKFGQANAILRRNAKLKEAAGRFSPKQNTAKIAESVMPGSEQYMSVLAHELGHAIEYNITGKITSSTVGTKGFELFGQDADHAKIREELIAVSEDLVGRDTMTGKPEYYYQSTELTARFFEKMIFSPGNLNDLAPTAVSAIERQAIKQPILQEFLMAATEGIDRGSPKFALLRDMRETYQKHLGKFVGNRAYGRVLAYNAMQERGKIVIERLIKEKFKMVRDEPSTLFRAAESILVTRSGVPEFGTRDLAVAKNPEDEQALIDNGYAKTPLPVLEDGVSYPQYAKQRYTPEEAKRIFESLSSNGQKLILDFTAQRKEAKDYFNREVIKDVNKINSQLEGWVHHYFADRPQSTVGGGNKFKLKTAGARKQRSGSEGYVEDFKKAMYKAMVDLEGEKVYNDFIPELLAMVTKPLSKGQAPDKGWVEVVGNLKTGVGLPIEKRSTVIDQETNKSVPLTQSRYQMPQAIYEQYKSWRGLIDEASTAVRVVNDINRYWRINILFHPGTSATNFASGGIQFSTKILTDFYREILTGQLAMKATKSNISAIIKVLMPQGWMDAPDWVYGGDVSNFYGQFSKFKSPISGVVDEYGDKTLKLFGTVERYWKKVIITASGVSDLKSLEKMDVNGLRAATKEEKEMLASINDIVDIYGYNYGNIPEVMEKYQRNAFAQSIKPFIVYPYKYAKHVLRMVGDAFDQQIPLADRTAKILALTTLVGAIALYSNAQKKKQETPTADKSLDIPPGLQTRGRLFIGKDKEGRELFTRVSKYPFFNLTEIGLNAADGNWTTANDIVSDMLGSIGPVGQMGLLGLGFRNKYQQYEKPEIILGDSLVTFLPGYRILNDVSRALDPFQRKQESFMQTFTQIIPTTDSALQEKLHGKIRTARVPIEGSVKDQAIGNRTTVDVNLVNYKEDILLSLFTGVYRTRLDPKVVEAYILRKTKNQVKP